MTTNPMKPEHASAFADTIQERRSIRAFTEEVPPRALVESILAAGLAAPFAEAAIGTARDFRRFVIFPKNSEALKSVISLLCEKGQAQLEAMHQAALEILEKAGANVHHDGALTLLAENGCIVDRETRTARMPTGVVEQCLQSCPSSYSIRGRDPDSDVRIGGTRVHFMQGMGMRYVDPETWELRPATLREHAEAQIVGDALASVHVMDACFSYTDIEGVPPIMQQLECLANGFRCSGKAQHYGYLKDSHRFAIKMAQGLGVTLSLGEQSLETYRAWHEAGAHRYLLRIESSDPARYAALHPADHHYETRVDCLKQLRQRLSSHES